MLSNNTAYYSSLENNVQFDKREIAEKSLSGSGISKTFALISWN